MQEPDGSAPQLSLVVTGYNEEANFEETIDGLFDAFGRAQIRLHVVAVDNGSFDRSAEILLRLAARNPAVTYCRVEPNEGYGNGVLRGLPYCAAPWLGMLPADGQVDGDDVVKLFQYAAKSRSPKLFKARRRFRMEGFVRRIVSVSYNAVATVLFGSLGTMDINANPKILPRDVVTRMKLESKDWFLDFEIVLKAKAMALPIFELNLFAQMRPEGISAVRPSTCVEFVRNLLRWRFGQAGRSFRSDLACAERAGADPVR